MWFLQVRLELLFSSNEKTERLRTFNPSGAGFPENTMETSANVRNQTRYFGSPMPVVPRRCSELGSSLASIKKEVVLMTNWTWNLRSREGAMNGLEFARATTAGGFTRALIHAAPAHLSIEVDDDNGVVIARAESLDRSGDYLPMTMVTIEGADISRSEVWPDDSHYGLPVLLAGGEVGLLRAWHHSNDHSWWQWSLELANHTGRPVDWAPPTKDVQG